MNTASLAAEEHCQQIAAEVQRILDSKSDRYINLTDRVTTVEIQIGAGQVRDMVVSVDLFLDRPLPPV